MLLREQSFLPQFKEARHPTLSQAGEGNRSETPWSAPFSTWVWARWGHTTLAERQVAARGTSWACRIPDRCQESPEQLWLRSRLKEKDPLLVTRAPASKRPWGVEAQPVWRVLVCLQPSFCGAFRFLWAASACNKLPLC